MNTLARSLALHSPYLLSKKLSFQPTFLKSNVTEILKQSVKFNDLALAKLFQNLFLFLDYI